MTGATFYTYRRDFLLDSNVPFVLKASGGDILADPALSSAPEAFASIVWDTSGESTAQRVFGFAVGGVSGTGTSQKPVGSLIVGTVITATSGGGEAFGQDIFFFGDNAGYFVMEGVGVDASGFKITSPIQIADTFGKKYGRRGPGLWQRDDNRWR